MSKVLYIYAWRGENPQGLVYNMRTTVLTIIMVFGMLKTIVAQDIQLPGKISISDKFFSPWGTHVYYEYELQLNHHYYSIVAITIQENGKNKKGNKKIGTVEKKLVENILLTIKQQPAKEIQVSDFQNQFTLEDINQFFLKESANYWITNEHQRKFIIEELTSPEKLKNNLDLYFKNYDHSGYLDGAFTEVKIIFHYADSVISICSRSILRVGLPLEINGEKNFSPQLAKLIGELIPKSKTGRKEQFECKDLFPVVIRETISNHRREIDNLESKSYQVHIDSLKKNFKVSNTRVINGTYSTNWNGEKRLYCTLIDSSMVSNVTFNYSTTIKNGTIKYPVSLIMKDYKQLYSLVMSSPFFREFLAGNNKRHLTIIYDDNSCFTNKTKEFALTDCKFLTGLNSFENAVFISLEDEFGNISRWGLLPNGQYFTWWNNGNPPTPTDDKNYIKCE